MSSVVKKYPPSHLQYQLKSILPAQPVGDSHHSLSLGFGIVIFSAVPKRNGIKANYKRAGTLHIKSTGENLSLYL